jgi:hypothetical protein
LLLVIIFVPVTYAQENPQPSPPTESVDSASGPDTEPEREDEKKFPEAEFVASDKFHSFSYVQPLLRGLHFEGHYFGVEGVDVGTVGGSWAFRLGRTVKLSPGFGVYFGEGQRTGPAFIFRWDIEKGPILSQGLFIQGFRKVEVGEAGEEKSVYPNIWDGNHVSLRWKWIEAGPSWERIHSREGNEWKGGGRFAFRILKNVSAVMFVLGPDTEVRGGVIIHPARPEE